MATFCKIYSSVLKRPSRDNIYRILSTVTSTKNQVGEFKDEEYTNAKPFDQIPSIPSIPIIGAGWASIPYFGRYDLKRLHIAGLKKYQQYGKLVREDITAGTTIVNVFDPDDVEKVMRTEGRMPRRLPFDSLRRVINKNPDTIIDGLLSAEDEAWYNLRSNSQQHLMKTKNVVNYLPSMDKVSIQFVQRLAELRQPNYEVPELYQELTLWALESIALVGLDTHLGCFEKNLDKDSDAMKIVTATFDLFEEIYRLEFGILPFWRKFDTPLFKKFEKTIIVFNSLASKYLKLAKKRLEERSDDAERQYTVLELLLQEKNNTEKMVTSIVRDMFAAGTDTTSNTLSFFLYCMARNPEIQEKVYKEISSLVKNENEPITNQHLNELRYTKACLKESQRLFPVTIGFSRKSGKNIVLSGYQVPEGTIMIVHQMVQNNLEVYHNDAKSFKPERWLRGTEDKQSVHPFLFLPFGFGPRACIGRRIAEQELYAIIIRLMSRFRIEYHYEDIGLITRLTNMPDKPLRYELYDR